MEIKWAQNIQILETGWSIFFETTFLQELQMIKDAVKCGWYSHIQFYVYFNYRWEVYHYLSFFWILLLWHIMPDKLESSNSWQVIYIYTFYFACCVCWRMRVCLAWQRHFVKTFISWNASWLSLCPWTNHKVRSAESCSAVLRFLLLALIAYVINCLCTLTF